MRLPIEIFILSFAHLTTASPVESRSADFISLRGLTNLDTDYSNPEAFTRPEKFFHESKFNSHYDGRFAKEELAHDERAFHLRLLVKSYMETMGIIGIRTWIMHGCLLGWWWNGRIMPWDSDVDVMVDERSIAQLGNWWNMTVHHFAAKDLGLTGYANDEVKKYLLEVNPNYTNISTRDEHNVIDARWIDTSTGLYIDITTVHVAPVPSGDFDSEEDDDLELYTKDQHAYAHSQISPLRTTTFESVIVQIPYGYAELLSEEYGPEALTNTWFNGYTFDVEKHEWVSAEPTEEQVVTMMERGKNARKNKQSRRGKGGES